MFSMDKGPTNAKRNTVKFGLESYAEPMLYTQKTRTAEIRLNSNGIIHAVITIPSAVLTLRDAEENIMSMRRMAPEGHACILADIRNVRYIERPARVHIASDESQSLMERLAILVDSPLTKLIGNLIIAFSTAKFPVRVFTSKYDAESWLSSALTLSP